MDELVRDIMTKNVVTIAEDKTALIVSQTNGSKRYQFFDSCKEWKS